MDQYTRTQLIRRGRHRSVQELAAEARSGILIAGPAPASRLALWLQAQLSCRCHQPLTPELAMSRPRATSFGLAHLQLDQVDAWTKP